MKTITYNTNIVAKKSGENKSKSYIKNYYKVLKSQYDFIDNLLWWAKKDSFKFVAHILSCQFYRYRKGGAGSGGYVPIPYVVRKRFCREAEIQELVSNGIIERLIIDETKDHTYSVEFNICTSYRIKESIIDEFIKLEETSAAEYIKSSKVNLFTGKRCRGINKSKVVDENNHKYPELIVKAISCIEKCIFELAPVENHIKLLKNEMLTNEIFYGKESSEYITSRGKYYNDNACLKNALNQNAEEILPGFYSFIPNYSISTTGRIHTFMQNASREMKRQAFKNVENLRNYDLRSSQAVGLIQQFEIAGLNTEWLENYRNDKEAKYNYAASIGISVDTWKRCLCALLMGGYIPCKYSDESKADILRYLMEEANGDLLVATEFLTKFTEAISPLKIELSKWHEWLLSTYVKKIGNYRQGKLYLTNSTNSKLCIDDLPKGREIWQRKAKVAAFVLQGQEASFIHHLTILSLEYDYKVIQNEHDGLVSLGVIPQQAIDRAAISAGMKFAVLDEKPLV